MNAKRTPEEVLRSIEERTLDEQLDEELESVLAMTPEQRRAELEAAGFDMKELHAKADELTEKLQEQAASDAAPEKQAEKAQPRPERPKAKPWVPERQRLPPAFWFAAATIAAAAAGGLVYALTHPGGQQAVPSRPTPSSAPAPEPPSQKLIAASDLRRRAFAECQASHWQECVARFDDARMLDPAGDEAPEVQAARSEALAEMERKRPKPPEPPKVP